MTKDREERIRRLKGALIEACRRLSEWGPGAVDALWMRDVAQPLIEELEPKPEPPFPDPVQIKTTAREMDPQMLRCLLWLLLFKFHGGKVTFTRADLQVVPWHGDILLEDGAIDMTLTGIVKPEPPKRERRKLNIS